MAETRVPEPRGVKKRDTLEQVLKMPFVRAPVPGELELFACVFAFAVALFFNFDVFVQSGVEGEFVCMFGLASVAILYYVFTSKIPGKIAAETFRFVFGFAMFVASVWACLDAATTMELVDWTTFFSAIIVIFGIVRAVIVLMEYEKARGERFVYKNISQGSLVIATLLFIGLGAIGRIIGLSMAISYLLMLEATQFMPHEYEEKTGKES